MSSKSVKPPKANRNLASTKYVNGPLIEPGTRLKRAEIIRNMTIGVAGSEGAYMAEYRGQTVLTATAKTKNKAIAKLLRSMGKTLRRLEKMKVKKMDSVELTQLSTIRSVMRLR